MEEVLTILHLKSKSSISTNAAANLNVRSYQLKKYGTGLVDQPEEEESMMMEHATKKTEVKELSALEQASIEACDIVGENAIIPAGKNESVTGNVVYTDGNGHQFNRETYINTHKVDPEVVWQEVKRRRAEAGKKDRIRHL